MAKRRKARRKNLSTGAWVAIAVGIGVVVPAAIVGGIMIYAVKKGSKMVDDAKKRQDDIIADFDDDVVGPNRPIPPIPPI